MNIFKFITKFTLISLIFSATQPVLAMNEPTNISLGSRLKNLINSPKTVTFLGFALYGYKTGNWQIATGLLGTTFVLYKIFDYRRNMSWRHELETLIPKMHESKGTYKQSDLVRAIELLCKINDKELNYKMSYWTSPVFKKALQQIVRSKNIENLEQTVTNLLPILNQDFLQRHAHNSLKENVHALFGYINNYNFATTLEEREKINTEIEQKYNEIKLLLPY